MLSSSTTLYVWCPTRHVCLSRHTGVLFIISARWRLQVTRVGGPTDDDSRCTSCCPSVTYWFLYSGGGASGDRRRKQRCFNWTDHSVAGLSLPDNDRCSSFVAILLQTSGLDPRTGTLGCLHRVRPKHCCRIILRTPPSSAVCNLLNGITG